MYRLGNSDAPDDYITEVRGLIAVAGGYLTLAQVVRRRDAPVRRVALYFSPNLVTWHRAGLLSAAQRVVSAELHDDNFGSFRDRPVEPVTAAGGGISGYPGIDHVDLYPLGFQGFL